MQAAAQTVLQQLRLCHVSQPQDGRHQRGRTSAAAAPQQLVHGAAAATAVSLQPVILARSWLTACWGVAARPSVLLHLEVTQGISVLQGHRASSVPAIAPSAVAGSGSRQNIGIASAGAQLNDTEAAAKLRQELAAARDEAQTLRGAL